MTATVYTVCVERGLQWDGTGHRYTEGARCYRLTLDLLGLMRLDAQLLGVQTARYWVDDRQPAESN